MENILKKSLTSALVAVVLVAFFALSIPVFLYRKLVSQFAKFFNQEVQKMLNSRSAALAVDDLRKSPVISEVFSMVLEGKQQLEMAEIRNIFREKVLERRNHETGELAYPELRQCITFYKDYPFWRNIKNFKLEDYVYVLPEYNEEPYDYKKLMKLACELKSKPFHSDEAIWEMIFIPKFIPRFDPKSGSTYSVLLFRQHHCLADGFSKIKFLQQLSFNPPPPFRKMNIPKTNWITSALFYFSLIVKLPFEIADLIMTTQPAEIWKLRKDSEGISPSPTMKYMGTTSEKVPLSIVKEIKNKFGVSFSAVAITAAIAAMEIRMIESRKNFDDLIMPMPFPMGGHPDKLRNHFSFAFLKVPMREPNIVKRLKMIDKRLESLKRSSVSILLGGVFGELLTSFPIGFVRKLLDASTAGHGMIMTNFPGPTGEMDMFGHSLKEIYTCGPAGSGTFGMISTFITYGDFGMYGVGGDLAILPDENCAEEVIREFHATLNYLRNVREEDKESGKVL